MSDNLTSTGMLRQARAWQKRGEALAALEAAQERWAAADRERDAAVERALAAGVSLRGVAGAIGMSFAGVRGRFASKKKVAA